MIIEISEGQERYADICEMYWQQNSANKFVFRVRDVMSKYAMNYRSISEIITNSCTAKSSKIKCISCGKPFQYTSRTNYVENRYRVLWECPECKENKEEFTEHKKVSVLEEFLERGRANTINIDTISFRHAVFLLSLIKFGGIEDLTYIQEISKIIGIPLSPSRDFDHNIICELYNENIIAIHPLSNTEFIELKADDGFSYYPEELKWLILLNEEDSPATMTRKLESKLTSLEYLKSASNEFEELCIEVSMYECLSYLDHELRAHQFIFNAGEKTKVVLQKALSLFSVSQVYCFIWKAAKDAGSFYLRRGVSKKHAVNTIAGNIERQYEKALANDWEVKSFKRNFDLPQSVISHVLFNVCLRTDDGGFSLPLSEMIKTVE